MDRIDTFQDLLDILDRNPEWAQALRERILTPELLELPEKFAAFAEMVNRRFEALEEMVNRRFEALETDVTELKTNVTTLTARVDGLVATVDGMVKDIADLKGHAVPAAARKMLGVIAQELNIRRPRWLEDTDLVDLSDDAELDGLTAGIPAGEIESFRKIDLAMTALDKAAGDPCYVVIECSYKLEQQDITRIKRNAEHMSRFTGKPAKPAAAATEIPEEVSSFAKSEGVACILITSKSAAPR